MNSPSPEGSTSRSGLVRIVLPTFLVAVGLASLWGVLFVFSLSKLPDDGCTDCLTQPANGGATSQEAVGRPSLVSGLTAADYFTNFGHYMPRIHCLAGADGRPDWPWIIGLIVLSAGVILAYLRIYVFWCRAYLAEDERDRNVKLMQLAQMFLWCAVSGYAASLLMFVWPAYRLVALCLVFLNLSAWRFALNLDSFRVSFSAKRFRRMAETDTLTGLHNRSAIRYRIDTAIALANAENDVRVGVLYIDFDRFKQVNDSLGHDAGDELIRRIGAQLKEFCHMRTKDGSESWSAARVGGDEFVLVAERIANEDTLHRAGRDLLNALDRPFDVSGHKICTSASIGACMAECGKTGSEAIRNADIAMYAAKSNGRACLVPFNESMQAHVIRRVRLESDLREAIASDALSVAYQPIATLEDTCVVGAEALARWDHPVFGSVSPEEFIPIAEETGLIASLGRQVLFRACKQLREWQDSTCNTSLTMSINVSRHQLRESSLNSDVQSAIAEAGVSPECIHLEITESVFLDDQDMAVSALNELRSLGVRIDIDDFGMGYSSLSCLHRFPLDRVKIDRSFTQRAAEKRDYAAVLHAVLTLAFNLDIEVVAEGIESMDQVALLLSLDCSHGQGYLFGRPVDGRTLLELARTKDQATRDVSSAGARSA